MADQVKFHGDVIINDKNGKALRAITRGQQELLEVIEKNDIIFVNGPAGTGKSVVSTWYGIAGIDKGIYDKLVLTRPIVEAGEELGFLPGTFEEKVAPYMQPLYEAIEVVKGKRITAEMAAQYEAKQPPELSGYRKKKVGKGEMDMPKQKQKITSNDDFYKKINVCPLAYLRGTTKGKSFIILDEAQNVTKTQMKLMLTRLGHGSKLIVCGDIKQSDLERKSDSGFRHAQNILKGVRGIGYVSLGIDDIVRHRLIKDIIIRYDMSENSTGFDKKEIFNNRESLDNDYDFEEDFDEEDTEEYGDQEIVDDYDDGDIVDYPDVDGK
jgi:phosphate starvation-inducible PhoH-like protein